MQMQPRLSPQQMQQQPPPGSRLAGVPGVSGSVPGVSGIPLVPSCVPGAAGGQSQQRRQQTMQADQLRMRQQQLASAQALQQQQPQQQQGKGGYAQLVRRTHARARESAGRCMDRPLSLPRRVTACCGRALVLNPCPRLCLRFCPRLLLYCSASDSPEICRVSICTTARHSTLNAKPHAASAQQLLSTISEYALFFSHA
eukprot:5993330-Pleurochrysis_carterae.AAC.1